MIQVRCQYDNIYIKILDKLETFEYTLQKIWGLPDRSFKMDTGEWMIPRINVGSLLLNFQNQIIWMTPLSEIVFGLDLHDEMVTKHLSWESDSDFKNFLLEMYPYQKVGANFLIDRKSGGIFDGCGLGKTPQLIGACEKVFDMGGSKALIVTLSSLKNQWSKEIEKFTGKKAIPVTGRTPNQRKKKIQQFIDTPDIMYLVINYEIMRSEELADLIVSIPFDIVGLDEAQKIKSGVTDDQLKIEPSLNAAGAHRLKYIPYRFIATATPLQGKAEEVFSLFYFIDESILGDWYTFRERYCKYSKRFGITGYINMGELYHRIAPYFIRRTKQNPEIQQQLPQVQHSHIFLEMTKKQEELHDYILQQYEEVKESSKKVRNSTSMYHLIGGKTVSKDEAILYYDNLAQGYQIFMLSVCDSPELLMMSDSNMAKKILAKFDLGKDGLKSPKVNYIKEFYEQMVYDEPESKIVIFTQFARMAELIQKNLDNSVIYHGGLSDNAKEEAKYKFVNDPATKVIVCTDAGSTGLNLQVANYMIHADFPWDPTLIEQRNGRIDRTGNKFQNVTIYYTAMSDSYDEHMLEIIDRKSNLANIVIDGGKSPSGSNNFSKLAMDSLLKKRRKQSAIAAH